MVVTGKRVRQTRRMMRHRLRLSGLLLLVVTAGALAVLSGTRGVAANSPLEQPAPPKLAEHTPEMPKEPAEPAGVMPEEPAPPPPPVEEAWAPVPMGETVADTYFDDVVFLGDSRTDGFRLYSGLNTGTYLYATGATVESVFSKSVDTPQGKMPLLDALAKTSCGKIYVMLGVNELGWVGTDTFRNQAAKMLRQIQTDHPEAVVVIQSLLPVSAEQDAKGSYVNNQRIGVYNQILRELAEELELPYLDVAEAVTDEDGCLRADWNFDGVHLNKAGCQAWLEYLRTHPVTT